MWNSILSDWAELVHYGTCSIIQQDFVPTVTLDSLGKSPALSNKIDAASVAGRNDDQGRPFKAFGEL